MRRAGKFSQPLRATFVVEKKDLRVVFSSGFFFSWYNVSLITLRFMAFVIYTYNFKKYVKLV